MYRYVASAGPSIASIAGWLASQMLMCETLSLYGGLAIAVVLSSKTRDGFSILVLRRICGGIVVDDQLSVDGGCRKMKVGEDGQGSG